MSISSCPFNGDHCGESDSGFFLFPTSNIDTHWYNFPEPSLLQIEQSLNRLTQTLHSPSRVKCCSLNHFHCPFLDSCQYVCLSCLEVPDLDPALQMWFTKGEWRGKVTSFGLLDAYLMIPVGPFQLGYSMILELHSNSDEGEEMAEILSLCCLSSKSEHWQVGFNLMI